MQHFKKHSPFNTEEEHGFKKLLKSTLHLVFNWNTACTHPGLVDRGIYALIMKVSGQLQAVFLFGTENLKGQFKKACYVAFAPVNIFVNNSPSLCYSEPQPGRLPWQ